MDKVLNTRHTKDLTKGSIYKNILVFALPIIFSNLFQQLYNSVDSIIVSNFLGKESLAAVGSSGNLIFLFTSFFIGTALGSGIVISKYFGRGDYENMSRAIHTDIAFGLVASIILTVLGYFLSPILLVWMKTDPDVLPNSIAYFRNYFLGATGIIMYNIFNGILNAVGNSRRPLVYLIISSLLNIVLDLLFIGVFKFGVGSAAIATAISQLFSACLCLAFLCKKGTPYQISFKKIGFNKNMMAQIIKYGMPSGIQNSVISIANVIVQSNINAFGKDAMAAYASYIKIEGFAFIPITSFNVAISTFTGQNLGAREYERAKKGANFGIISCVSLAVCVGLVMFTFPKALLSVFTRDPEVIAYGTKEMRTICLFYALLAFSHAVSSVCRGAGRAFVPMLVMLIVWCGIRITYITIITKFTDDIFFVYLAYPITWSISSVIYLLYYLFSDWIHGFEPKLKDPS